jgi:hypothetical protein
VLEQPSLGRETAGKAGEPARGSHDAVAGDDDRDRIAAAGSTDGARGAGMPDAPRDLSVAARLSKGDAREFLPDPLLKVRAARDETQIEAPPHTAEVLAQLLDHRSLRERITAPRDCERPLQLQARLEGDDLVVVPGDAKGTDRAVEQAPEVSGHSSLPSWMRLAGGR